MVVHKSKESIAAVAGDADSQGLYLEMEDGTVELHVLYDGSVTADEFNYVMMHEVGHHMTESLMANPETRRKLYDEGKQLTQSWPTESLLPIWSRRVRAPRLNCLFLRTSLRGGRCKLSRSGCQR